jgi:hypothetical protein
MKRSAEAADKMRKLEGMRTLFNANLTHSTRASATLDQLGLPGIFARYMQQVDGRVSKGLQLYMMEGRVSCVACALEGEKSKM